MALGFAEVSGIKLEYGLIRNHYVGRTFINPTQNHRVAKVKIKFNPVRDVIQGKSVVVVDDSLVRGNTSKSLVQMIRAAGAREVHLRLGSPPITGPCHYGIDTPTREELIASTHSIEEIREFLGVDSLGYLSLDGMLRAAGDRNGYCHACFSGPVSDADSRRAGAAAARVPAGGDAGMSGPYAQPLVYFFGQGRADGTAGMKDVLGGKGAGLAEMTTIGIPVPPGFTIASSLCLSYLESHQFPKRLQVQVQNALHRRGGGHREALRGRRRSPARDACARARRCRCPA